MEAVHAEWKQYLNLLICEESHLKYMEDYHQVPAWLQARERVSWVHAEPLACVWRPEDKVP